jgi:alkylation response protein AidB-like acyl-CoA dehydrogenase
VNWLGPTLMKFGTPGQQAEFLPQIAAGNIIWCQGYSEPGAGSDLAALKTRAVRDGDDYVINGSKIWTSYSRKADYCFLLARTGNDRKEISIFLLPMSTPGVKVTPIPGITEQGHLNEIFLTDVRVPASARVGEEGRAWDIIAYALSYERIGIARYELGRRVLDIAVAQLKSEGRFSDPLVRVAAGRALSKLEAARMLTYLVVDQRAKGRPPTSDSNVARVAGAQASLAVMDFLAEYVPDCLLEGDKDLELYFRGNIASTIAAGTYEIQLNLVAQNALHLPRSK